MNAKMPEKDRRNEDEGPSERGVLGRLFCKDKRFGLHIDSGTEPASLYDRGDPAFAMEQIGVTRAKLRKAVYFPEQGEKEEARKVRRLTDAMEYGDFYYGPQYVKIQPGSEVDNELRKKLKVRKGDIIEVSPSIVENGVRAGGNAGRPGYDTVFISVKSADEKGQQFFYVDRESDAKLEGELISVCYKAIDEGAIKLFPHEKEGYELWRTDFFDKMKEVVEEIGEEDGEYLNLRFSRLAKAFEERDEGTRIAIPEIKRLAKRLSPRKTIRIIDDRTEKQKEKDRLYF